MVTALKEELTIHPADIVLIQGPSGSGKTQLLRHLQSSLVGEVVDRVDCQHLTRPLIEQWDETPQHNAELLSSVGLGDVLTWCKLPEQLSDGQRERFDLALMIEQQPDFIIVDEFAGRLDKVTGLGLAHIMQKRLRESGTGALIASNVDGIEWDLKPDIIIKANWQQPAEVRKPEWKSTECTLLSHVDVYRGSRAHWERVKHLHYAAGNPATFRDVFVARFKPTGEVIGVVVFSYPDLHSAARNIATGKDYQLNRSSGVASKINSDFARLSRLVIHPEWRCIGVARTLLNASIPTLDVKFVECTTALGRYNSFLSGVGFIGIAQSHAQVEDELIDASDRDRVPAEALLSSVKLSEWVDALSVRNKRRWKRMIWKLYHQLVLHRRTRRACPAKIPGPHEPGWNDAFELATRRINERPSYWIVELDPEALQEGVLPVSE